MHITSLNTVLMFLQNTNSRQSTVYTTTVLSTKHAREKKNTEPHLYGPRSKSWFCHPVNQCWPPWPPLQCLLTNFGSTYQQISSQTRVCPCLWLYKCVYKCHLILKLHLTCVLNTFLSPGIPLVTQSWVHIFSGVHI